MKFTADYLKCTRWGISLLSLLMAATTLQANSLPTVVADVESVQTAPDSLRHSELWNFGWKFKLGDDAHGMDVTLDDSGWRTLDLPHDMQIEQPWDKKEKRALAFKGRTKGWYRKTFKADAAWKNKRVIADFEGLMMFGDVYLNGHKVGGTDYGYCGFECDLTPHLNWQGDNVLAVFTDTGNGRSRWYTGGGINRNVHLVLKEATAIARHGVFVYTPEVTDRQAKVNVQVEIEGASWKKQELTVEVQLLNPAGAPIYIRCIQPEAKSNSSLDEQTLQAVVENPQRWSCESPNLYTAVVTLKRAGRIIDKLTQRFGIRTVEFGPDFGFRLNGKKVLLKGVSNHHDFGAVGAAAFKSSIRRQFETMKAFGFNTIRCSHNPYPESFYQLADEMGILVVDELYDKWSNESYWPGRCLWTDSWPKDIPEWVKRDRNHPSVIMWSLGNELQIREDWCGYPTNDWGVTTYKMLDAYLKRWDNTRKTTVAMYPAFANAVSYKKKGLTEAEIKAPELSLATEVASYNYRWMNFDAYSKANPHLILFQSEAATYELGKAFFGMNLNKVAGLAYWGVFDYWGESNAWPWKGWHYSYFDHTLQPSPQAYFIKSMFSAAPLVRIGIANSKGEAITWNDVEVGRQPLSSSWSAPSGSKVELKTFTNAEEVELLVNGKSIGVQRNDTTDIAKRNVITWTEVPYEAGSVTAIARTAGKEVARHELQTVGKAVALKIELEKSSLQADGMDLMYARVKAVDKKGRVVTTAQGEVTLEVEGAANLIAVDNGDLKSDELFGGGKRQLYQGTMIGIIRASHSTGRVTLKAACNGLKADKVQFICK